MSQKLKKIEESPNLRKMMVKRKINPKNKKL